MNFAPAPIKFPLVDTMAVVEEGARKLTDMDADDLCGQVCRILRQAKFPKDNLTKEQRRALKELTPSRCFSSLCRLSGEVVTFLALSYRQRSQLRITVFICIYGNTTAVAHRG